MIAALKLRRQQSGHLVRAETYYKVHSMAYSKDRDMSPNHFFYFHTVARNHGKLSGNLISPDFAIRTKG